MSSSREPDHQVALAKEYIYQLSEITQGPVSNATEEQLSRCIRSIKITLSKFPHILNIALDTGVTLAWMLAHNEAGCRVLLDYYPHLTPESLNTPVTLEVWEGISTLWLLAATKTQSSSELLQKIKGKITAKGLNHYHPRLNNATTPAWWLSTTTEGQEVLVHCAHLLDQRSVNTPAKEEEWQGTSMVWWLAKTKNVSLLRTLLHHITNQGLCTASQATGVSAMLLLAAYPEGRQLLLESESLCAIVISHRKAFNETVPSANHFAHLSAARFFLINEDGRKLLLEKLFLCGIIDKDIFQKAQHDSALRQALLTETGQKILDIWAKCYAEDIGLEMLITSRHAQTPPTEGTSPSPR
ncbi:MAG: hypothetical protein A3E83_08425 [Gammaproteobacteria bacterium RIFCSPHIGHO2_12_FULL_41_20]|nr:MAG: hypothetical protein A3E83_08425 [Gammaproteobacteria bacterium RIFCSPHIGHO2_12_FULL_41_20]